MKKDNMMLARAQASDSAMAWRGGYSADYGAYGQQSGVGPSVNAYADSWRSQLGGHTANAYQSYGSSYQQATGYDNGWRNGGGELGANLQQIDWSQQQLQAIERTGGEYMQAAEARTTDEVMIFPHFFLPSFSHFFVLNGPARRGAFQ